MIRRLGILFVLTLSLAACAGAERDAVAVGDTSISRAELLELLVAVDPGGPDELPATISADELRVIANAWARDVAVVTALEEQDVVVTEDELVEINTLIDAALDRAEIGALSRDSGGYEALQRNVWVTPRIEALDQAVEIRAQELLDDAEVESRLGIVDPETSLIVAR